MKEFKGYKAKIDESQKVKSFTKQVSEISTITAEAIVKGWQPPNLDEAVDWWAERIRTNPEFVVEDYIDGAVDGKSDKELIDLTASYYESEADNYLIQLESGEGKSEKVIELDPESCIGCPFQHCFDEPYCGILDCNNQGDRNLRYDLKSVVHRSAVCKEKAKNRIRIIFE